MRSFRSSASSRSADRRRRGSRMPAVGARRSTRAFVPRVADTGSKAAVVLRSGKRLVPSRPVGEKVEAGACGVEWWSLFGGEGKCWNGDEGVGLGVRWRKSALVAQRQRQRQRGGGGWTRTESGSSKVEGSCKVYGSREVVARAPESRDKRFGIVYTRKRQRSIGEDQGDQDNRKYGITFMRRREEKRRRTSRGGVKVAPLTEDSDVRESDVSSSWDGIEGIVGRTRNFCKRAYIDGNDLWNGPCDSMVLLVLVDPSVCDSYCLFSCFLASTLGEMIRKRVRLLDLSSFLLAGSVAGIFSEHGLHFLPVQWGSYISHRNNIIGAGVCGITGALALTPLLSLNFTALPSFFGFLHSRMLLDHGLGRLTLSRHEDSGLEELDMCGSVSPDTQAVVLQKASIENNANLADAIFSVESNRLKVGPYKTSVHATRDLKYIAQYSNPLRIHRHQKKRSTLRSPRVRTSLVNPQRNSFSSFSKDILKARPLAKSNSPKLDTRQRNTSEFEDTILNECPSDEEDSALPSQFPSNKKSNVPIENNSIDVMKELKSAIEDLKQSIDSVSCKANILMTESDRCWREEGAQVTLELSDSKEWCLAIKLGGSLRFLHKTQETRQWLTNRYTHAMIWSGDSGWRLEFNDRSDWVVFRELLSECFQRNSCETLPKIIPVPVVKVVPGYEDNHGVFVLPEFYISTEHNELERALMSETPMYDMDSEDENWLEQLNSRPSGGVDGKTGHVLKDEFEKAIHQMENVAYKNPDDVCDRDQAISSLNLCNKDHESAIFDYWLTKRKHKNSALMRIFQEFSKKKTCGPLKPVLRKKRSFKKQFSMGNHGGRGKPEIYAQAGAMQEELLRRIQEKRHAERKAVEVATRLRARAQVLMANADLAVYKSVMALRMAEAMQEAADLSSLIID